MIKKSRVLSYVTFKIRMRSYIFLLHIFNSKLLFINLAQGNYSFRRRKQLFPKLWCY